MKQHDPANDPTTPAPHGPESIQDFFLRYAYEFNRGLGGAPDMQALADLYAEAFIASAPAGVVTGRNDSELARLTVEGFRRYRDIGMKRMELESVTVSSIDALHALAHTAWNAVYSVDGGEKSIRFVNAYLMRIDAHGALRVFGWITGDEKEAMRRHGIADLPAKPVAEHRPRRTRFCTRVGQPSLCRRHRRFDSQFPV